MRMYLKKKKSYSFKFIFLLLFLFILFGLLIKLFNYASYFYLEYADSLAKSKMSNLLNKRVRDNLYDYLDTNDLYSITRGLNDEIEMIDYNSYKVNTFLSEITSKLQNDLNDYENSSDYLEIPLLAIFNNPIISDKGPLIKGKIKAFGSLNTNIRTSVSNYGINNALITMELVIDLKIRVVLPVVSKEIKLSNYIPISYKIIKGKIPTYYSNSGLSQNSNLLSIPFKN